MKFFIGLWIASHLLAQLTEASYPASSIGKREIAELNEMITSLEHACPPTECILIAIGRSPTPWMAMAEATGRLPNRVILPLSQFSYRNSLVYRQHPEWTPSFETTSDRMLKFADERKLFSHFFRFLPSAQTLGEKRIVVMDYSKTGASLLSAAHYIEAYYRSQQTVHPQISVIAFSDPSTQAAVERRLKAAANHSLAKTQVVALRQESHLQWLLHSQAYDELSPYSAYAKFDQALAPQIQNPKYFELVHQFKTKISQPRDQKGGLWNRCLNSALQALSGRS